MPQTALQIEEVKLTSITPDPGQPRKLMDERALHELADSIKEHGVIQPILLRKGEDDQNVIVAGERRFKELSGGSRN